MHELVLFNGNIYTMESEADVYYALGVDKGRVSVLYKKEEYKKALPKAKQAVDLNGKTVVPGLIDSHAHFMSYIGLCVFGCAVHNYENGKLVPESFAETLQKIEAECAKSNMPALLFYNFCVGAIDEKRLPTKEELNKICHGKAIIVMTTDGHSSSLNDKMLSAVQIESDNGILEGAAHETVQGQVISVLTSSIGVRELAEGVAIGVNKALAYGITTICALDGFDDLEKDSTFELFMRFAGALPISIRVFPQFKDINRVLKHRKRFLNLRIGGCGAWELDGAVGSHSAAFSQPYKDRPDTCGKLYFNTDELLQLCKNVDSHGAQISMHAIGESACEQAVEVYEKLNSTNPLHRIDHFEFPSKSTVDRIKKLNVTLVPQPGYAFFDKNFFKSYEHFLSPEYVAQQIPLKELFEAGLNIAGGSDAPVQDINPYIQLHGMTNFPLENQRLSPYQAFSAYTVNGGKALGELDLGNLKIGAKADMVIYENNPLATKNLLSIMPCMVYRNGKPVKKVGKSVASLLKYFISAKNKI